MDIKRLGSSFGLTFLAGLAGGKSSRTAFREAGLTAIAENTFQGKPDLAHGVEVIARGISLSRDLDQPITLDTAAGYAPTGVDYRKASQEIEALVEMDSDQLIQLDKELIDFEAGIMEARQVIFTARENKLRKLRKENLDK